MRAGRFEEAWTLSDRDLPNRRTADKHARPRHLQNIWDGSPLEGRRVLVRCYHGLGDTLQFARYLPRLQAVARDVTVWTPDALIPLLQRSIDGVRFSPLHDGSPDVAYDVDVEIMELAHVFRTTIDTIPADVPYLHVPRSARRQERRQIGLAWRGGEWDSDRSIPFDLIEAFLSRIADAIVVPLQASLTAGERERFGDSVPVAPVTALACELVKCDLVISVDTMPAHLAGALGVPTWTLLKHSPDWRWMTRRTDSPWYPSMRLFRQRSHGAWKGVLDDVSERLSHAW